MRFSILLAISVSTASSADFTTYIGSASPAPSIAVSAIATDSAGDTYVTGSNAFVTKLDPSGNIVFTTSLGPAYSYGNAIAVDPAGNIWVGGQTTVSNFPLMNALQSSGFVTGFLVKLAPDGTVAYSSYFGGVLGNSGVNGVATDQDGNVYVTGFTDAGDFPTTAGLPASPVTGSYPPVYGLFAAKLDPTGQNILYSTVIAGSNCASCGTPNVPRTVGIAIAVDGSGDAVVAGDTDSTDLPETSASNSVPEAFVFKINAAGNELVYFNYLASGASVGSFFYPDTAPATPIAADVSGSAYLVGSANSVGFATKLSPSGTTVWTESLGSLNPSGANSISLDSSDNLWLTGPGFVAELSADGSKFLYSEPFPTGAAGQAIAGDPSGTVHFAGSIGLISTLTPTEPLRAGPLSVVNAASNQLTGTVAPGEIISIYGIALGPSPITAVPEDGQFPASLGGVQVLVNGTAIPLLYVSAAQINAEIPTSVAEGGLVNGMADLQVVYNSSPLPEFRLALVPSNFAGFQNEGSTAVINQDGTLNKMANPAKPGTVVSLWATGFGASGAPVSGAVATAADNYCSACQVTLMNESASITETVQYAGTSPGQIDGLMQVNFLLPAGMSYAKGGAFVYFTPPGAAQPLNIAWVNVSQ